MNMICRSLVSPAFELNEPRVRSIEVALTSKNTLRILNTIKPVARVFTAMEAAKAVRVAVNPKGSVDPGTHVFATPTASGTSQVARGV